MTEQPKKLYFTISEVAKLTEIKAHVLRYWESEFPTLRPRKTRTGARRYRQPDIDEILAIKKLLYDEGFRITGARKMRRQAHRKGAAVAKDGEPQMAIQFNAMDPKQQMAHLKEELDQVMKLLKDLQEDVVAAKNPGSGGKKGGKTAKGEA